MLATLTRLAAVQGSIVGRIITGRWTWVRDVEIKLKTRQLAKGLTTPAMSLSTGQPITLSQFFGQRRDRDNPTISFGFPADKFRVWFVGCFGPKNFCTFSPRPGLYGSKDPVHPSIHPSGVLSVWLEFSCLRANSCCYFKFYFAVPEALEQP